MSWSPRRIWQLCLQLICWESHIHFQGGELILRIPSDARCYMMLWNWLWTDGKRMIFHWDCRSEVIFGWPLPSPHSVCFYATSGMQVSKLGYRSSQYQGMWMNETGRIIGVWHMKSCMEWKNCGGIYRYIIPRCSMCGIFSYVRAILGVDVGKYSMHGASGICFCIW